ncbi:MAG: nucleotidyl transferase AbiEii/AbiGii toxin family protein [Candidatus Omnitrophota bacterium]
MIAKESIKKLSLLLRTAEFPNVVREYFQHLFLSYLYSLEGSEKMLFKGGTALRIIYGSMRFSEDLDFSLFAIKPYNQKKFIEDLISASLKKIERAGINVELGKNPNKTSEGYYLDASFNIYDYPKTSIAINVSCRKEKKIEGEVDSIVSDFIPVYNLLHLPQEELVDEKVFGALLNRFKPRDFYDLYFIMRKGILTLSQKSRLNKKKEEVIKAAGKIDFSSELSVFLPQDQQNIIKNFKNILTNELNRQLSSP